MFVTNWISTTKIQKISEITNFFRHYFLSRTEVMAVIAASLSLFLGIAYLLRNMYLCSLIQDSNNDYEYAK